MIKNYKILAVTFLAAILLATGCKKTEYNFGEIKTPSNVVVTTSIVGATTANPTGNGSGEVNITVTATNALTYKIDFGDGVSQVVPTGIIKHKYTNTGEFNYTITVNAVGTAGVTSTTSKTIKVLVTYEPPAEVIQFLTGGSSKSWKLDPADDANAITVGTEANPAQYYPGGPLADCQKTDVYTFTTGKTITYNANGSTFNGGNISPNYNCGDDRSYTNQAFSYSAVTGGVAGLVAIKLPGLPPDRFIGTTDVPSENVYRIIEISATKMVLRAGDGSGTVFQFKLIAL